jgi:hypothetical protein
MQRLRPLSEEECYLRCYGWIGTEDAVKVVPSGDPATAADADWVMTERIRLAFEARLAAHEAEAA